MAQSLNSSIAQTMTQYIIRRFLQMIPITLGILTLIFSLIHLIPGDPAVQIAGEGARPHDVQNVRIALGLDKPLWQQYVTRSEEHTSELQSQSNLVCRLLLEKKNKEDANATPL